MGNGSSNWLEIAMSGKGASTTGKNLDLFKKEVEDRLEHKLTEIELKGAAAREQAEYSKPINTIIRNSNLSDNPLVANIQSYSQWLKANPSTIKLNEHNAEELEQKRQEEAKNLSDWAGKNLGNKVVGSLGSVGTSLLSGGDYISKAVEQATIGKTLVRPGITATEATQAIRGGVSKDMGDTGKFLYNTAMSGIDSLVASVGGNGGAVLLGLSAASNAYDDIKARGGSEKQALVGGAVSGIFESLFEKFSIGNLNALKEMPVSSAKTIFQNIAKSALTNFSEEAATEIANLAYDYLVMGDLSNYAYITRQYEAQYKAQGMSATEAKAKAEEAAKRDLMKQVLEAGASGALMGVGFAGVGTAASEHGSYKAGEDLKNHSAQYDLVQLALHGDKNSQSRKMAENIASKLDASKDATVGSRDIGRLSNMMAYEAEQAAEKEAKKNKTSIMDVFKPAKSKADTSAQTTEIAAPENTAPATEVEQVAAVQEANPDTHVVPTSVNLFMEAGDDSATATRKSEILARVTSGDTTLSKSQLRKLDLNSAATRAVLQSVTGQAVPQTNDTKTLLNYGLALVEQYAQANSEQAAIQSQIETMAAEAAEQAEKVSATDAEQQIRQLEAEATAMAQQSEAQPETVQPVAQPQQASEAPVQLSDGRSVTKSEFVEKYKAANPGKSEAAAKKMYEDAVRGNAMGMPYPAAVLQKVDSAAQRSVGSQKRHSVDAVAPEAQSVSESSAAASEGKPTKAQEWTAKRANHVLSKRAGGPKVALRNDLAYNVKGYYDKATKTVYLNANRLTTQQELTYTLSHELVHSVSGEQQTQLVNDICAFYEKIHGAEATQTELDNLRETYINQEMRANGLSRTEAEAKVDIGYIKEELAADFMSVMMENTGGLNRLAEENNGWLQTLRSKAVNLMRDLKGKITGNTEARALYNEAEALVDRMDRALKSNQEEDVSATPDDVKFSVEAEELISELNDADIDDYTTPSYEVQSRAWFLPEVVEIRNRKFTDTAGLPNRKALRDKTEKTLMNNGSWDGAGYSGDVKIGYHADIVIGLPGSGKSTVAANPLSQKNQARVIDSDMAKEMLPEFDDGKGSANVHNESAKIRDKVMDSTVERGENLVFVTVGDNYARLKNEAQRLYDAGYEIAVYYVDVTPKQALARSLRRFITENGEPGRYVPLDTVLHSADDLRANVRELAQTGLVDFFEVIDNRGSKPVSTTGTPEAVGKFDFSIASLMNGVKGGKKIEGSWDETPTVPKKEKYKVKTKGLTALEKQVSKIAKSKSFKSWFHDGNGELIDEETGLPRIFYHGTGTAGYTRFLQQRKSEPGFWFAKNRSTSDAPYYTGRVIGDTETQEFVPVSAKSWEEVEDFLDNYAPVLELGYSRETGNYIVEDAATGDILGEFEDSEDGLKKFNDSYQTMIQSSSAVADYIASDDRSDPPNPGMYRVFLSMKNPLVVHCEGNHWNRLSPFMVNDKRVQKAIIEKDVKGLLGYSDPNRPVVAATRDFTAVAQQFGYDGVIFKDVIDGRKEFILSGGGSATLEDVYDIMEKYGNFGAPDADIALSFIEDSGEMPSKMSEEDKAVVQAFLDSEESSDTTGEFRDLPDDDFVVFDSSQIKSLHNEGTFDPSNPDIRYSVDKEDKKTKTGGNTGNVNPDTGYERGSVADSFMRIWNTGDRETALSVLEQTVARLSEMEAEQAEKRRAEATANAFRPAGRLTEDAIARNKRVIEELIAKYGKMEQTSAAQQEVSLPKQRDDKTKVRGFMQTAAAAEVTSEAMLNEFERAIVDGDAGATYVPIGDKGTLRRATEALEKEGFDSLLRQWEGKFEAGESMGKDDIAKAEQLYVEACNNRDTVTAMKLAAQIAVAGTQAGQAVQAMTLLKKMTPSGNLYYIQKAVDRLNKDQKGKHKDIVINEQLAKQLLEAETQEEIQNALDAICQDLANQMPVTLMDKWNTWRYLAMLGNPRTHIRNLLGNAVFTPARLMKDMLGATAELALPVEQRTKAYTVSADLRDFAKHDAETMKDTLRGGGKYNPADMIRDKRRIFRSNALNAAEQFNSAMLEAEDWLFLKSAYSHALGSFLSARGADVSTISGANSTREGRALLEEARAYAVKEAQKATYRDMSKLAGTINHLKRNTGLAGEVFLEGLVPFTKTPINIVKRGIEYSPAGLVKGVVDMATKVRKGDMSAAEGLDELCAGLTGTAIVGIGALLTKLGLLVAGHSDDDEDNFEELQGIQEYSLKIGDSTFTVDWTAPVALPLFVGSEIYSVMSADADEDVDAIDAIVDGLTTMFEPMLSLSMLDGLNKTLSANKYGEEDDALYNIMATVISSYASQGVPTLFGQIARTVDDSRRTSFTPKGAGKVESWLSRAFQTSVQGKIPVAAEGRMLYIDNWGRADTESNVLMRALENFVSPGYINEIKTSPVDDELKRLADAVNDTSVFPDRAKKYFSVDKEDYAMSQEEYQAHLIERGQHSYQLVSDITNDSLYAGMDDKTRAQAVTMAYDYASSIAKLNTNAEYDPDKWMLKLYELEQAGGDVAEYLLLRAESKISGSSLTEVALGNSSLTDKDVVNITVMETTMPESFTDPYTTGHEYIMNSEQQKQYEQFYRDYLAEEYSYLVDDGAYQEASASDKYEMLKDIKTRVGKLTREAMSDWLWEQGIEPTPKN